MVKKISSIISIITIKIYESTMKIPESILYGLVLIASQVLLLLILAMIFAPERLYEFLSM